MSKSFHHCSFRDKNHGCSTEISLTVFSSFITLLKPLINGSMIVYVVIMIMMNVHSSVMLVLSLFTACSVGLGTKVCFFQ